MPAQHAPSPPGEVGAAGLGVARRAGPEGRLVGGASPRRRALPAGAALCLPPSLPPARRRSQAALPASASRSRSWRCALAAAAAAAPARDPPPEPPALGSQRPGRRSPRGRGAPGRGSPTVTELDPQPPG